MPELPEVETVRRGLAPYLEGARIDKVTLNRKDLRFPVSRRASSRRSRARPSSRSAGGPNICSSASSNGKTWLGHLGMTGAFRFAEGKFKEPSRYYEPGEDIKHDHVVMRPHPPQARQADTSSIPTPAASASWICSRTRRTRPYLEGLGPEPLGNDFNAEEMAARFKGKTAPMKAALLDQRVVAGLGNIYVTEALHRAPHPAHHRGEDAGAARAASPPPGWSSSPMASAPS